MVRTRAIKIFLRDGMRSTDILSNKIGKLLRFIIKEVDQWVREGKVAPTPDKNDCED